MSKRRLISIGFLVFSLLVSYNVYAQYTVTGGTGAPLLAEENTNNDVSIYLLYGMNNAEISYSSSSTSHQWFRYKTKALEAEPVTAMQNGTTSVVSDPEEGYGYFVKESTGFTKYIWIIDYSKYNIELNSLQVSQTLSDCDKVKLEGNVQIDPMYYYTPLGNRTELQRSFELRYETMKWNESGKFFESESITKEIKGNPLEKALTPAPYADTYFTLTGDLFGRHFEVEQTITSDFYTAVALQVEADSVIINESKQLESGEFSAPLDVRFTAYANEPVANSFTWTITSADSTKTPVIYRTDEVEHSFDREGTYNVELRVLDRTGVCETILNTHQIKISNFYLDAPNVFSPGASPGINDEFKILYRSIISFKGWIFNRWGNEMFYWTNPDLGWDGKKGGKYVPPGVYFYVLEAKGSDGKLHKKTGSISILRSKTERNEIIE